MSCVVDDWLITTMDLAHFLGEEQERLGYRGLEDKTKVSRSALEDIIKRQLKELPKIETLQKIAIAYELPLWSVVEMAGINLKLPQTDDERTRRLMSLAQDQPPMQKLVDRLLQVAPTHPQFVDGMLGYLEYELAKLGAVDPQ